MFSYLSMRSSQLTDLEKNGKHKLDFIPLLIGINIGVKFLTREIVREREGEREREGGRERES